MAQPAHIPRDITIDRQAGRLTIVWTDGHAGSYELSWLRAYCPCATCREARRSGAAGRDRAGEELTSPAGLSLTTGPGPSSQITHAELVGGYALRLVWGDGHDTGIYTFSTLRASCPCGNCNPDGPPPLLPD